MRLIKNIIKKKKLKKHIIKSDENILIPNFYKNDINKSNPTKKKKILKGKLEIFKIHPQKMIAIGLPLLNQLIFIIQSKLMKMLQFL